MENYLLRNENQYNPWVQCAKGLAILAVIFGHIPSLSPIILRCIFCFHIPFFFFISGYLFNFDKYEFNFKKLIIDSSKRLLLPYFIAAIVLTDCLHNFKFLLNFLYGSGNVVKQIPHLTPIGALWSILKFIKRQRVFISYIIAVIGCMLGERIRLPWSFDISLVSVYFLYIGFLIKKYGIHLPKYLIILFAVSGSILEYCGGISMDNREYFSPLISLNGSICSIILILYFCIKLNRIVFLRKIFSYLGKNSLLILIVHGFVYFQVDNWFEDFLGKFMTSIVFIEAIGRIPLLKTVFGVENFMTMWNDKII